MKILVIAEHAPLCETLCKPFEWAARGAFHTLRSVERSELEDAEASFGEFDVIVDVCARGENDVIALARRLGTAARYLLISNGSVYADSHAVGLDEEAALRQPTVGSEQDLAAAERAARRLFGEDRTLILRPGWVTGPSDPGDQLASWFQRIRQGGEVLAPAPARQRVQWVDGRDLADWALSGLARGLSGTFNVCGPKEHTTLEQVLTQICAFANSDARLVWVDEVFLEREGIRSGELPLWAPEDSDRGHVLLDGTKAFLEGFEPRRLEDSLQEIQSAPLTTPRLSLKHEREVLGRWSKTVARQACALHADRQI